MSHLEKILPVAKSLIPAPARLISSPYLRARQTAEIANRLICPAVPLEVSDSLRQESDPMDFVEFLSDNQAEVVLAVSHQPFLGRAVGWFTAGKEFSVASVPRAGISWIQFTRGMGGGDGKLKALIRPDQLLSLTGSGHNGIDDSD